MSLSTAFTTTVLDEIPEADAVNCALLVMLSVSSAAVARMVCAVLQFVGVKVTLVGLTVTLVSPLVRAKLTTTLALGCAASAAVNVPLVFSVTFIVFADKRIDCVVAPEEKTLQTSPLP